MFDPTLSVKDLEAAVTDAIQEIERSSVLQPQRDRMSFLDGIRGAAALFVVFHHAYMQLNWRQDGGGLSRRMQLATRIFSGGGYGVVTFIVLSGYCLMLPVVRTGTGTLRGGSIAYLLRRCKRILPPYYAALVIAILMIWWIPNLSVHPAFFADAATPLDTPSIVSHALLLQDLKNDWNLRIDPAMWSVAVEFQIYFLFPFLLLPIYRRFGVTATVIFGYAVATLFSFITHGVYDYAQPHFVGLFCMGMLAADVTAGHGVEVQRLRRLPWLPIGALGLMVAVALAFLNPAWAPRSSWAPHVFFGIFVAATFIVCGLQLTGGKLLRRCLEARWLIWISTFSYSLYLVHMPFEGLIFLALRHYVHSPNLQLTVNFAVSVPLVCLMAYCFYWVFERPFVKHVTANH